MQPQQRMSRRQLLRLAGGVSILALFDQFSWDNPDSAAAAAAESRWWLVDGLPSKGTVVLPALSPDHPFTAIVLGWRAGAGGDHESVQIEVSTSEDGARWSEWSAMQTDSHVTPTGNGWHYAMPLLRAGRQLRLRITTRVPLAEIAVSAINTDAGRQSQAVDLIDGFIIPRAAWGADESWRHVGQDFNEPLVWPARYAPVHKVVIHHTDTEFGYDDPAAMIRAVYYYHAIMLEWGDIGYNYLIDWAGNVYEGRIGGQNVIGAHALNYNAGSMGIALVGDFMNRGPSDAAVNALIRLIRTRAPQVDVTAASNWVDLANVPNLCGHGTLMSTACPGDVFAAQLPDLRGWIAETGPIEFPPPIPIEGTELVDFRVSPRVVNPGGVVEVRARIRNIGLNTLYTQGPEPGFEYAESQDFETAGFLKVEGSYRLAVGYSGNTGIPNPYRWGLGGPLASGEEREVVGYIRMETFGATTLSGNVVKEFVRYYAQDRAPQTVNILHPLATRTVQAQTAGGTYFEVSGHNVPEPFAAYWSANGGLERFGYPLTEAFDEVSETDGQAYLTQYFERARFEYHPEHAGTESEVLLGHLGVEMTRDRRDEEPFQPIEPFESTDEVVYVPETGHTSSYRFRQYWLTNGGLASFGYPISEKFEEVSATDGAVHLVQYFERTRFEYHPQIAEYDKQILLGHLGREILIRRGWIPGPDVS